jgi:hypothetical protein
MVSDEVDIARKLIHAGASFWDDSHDAGHLLYFAVKYNATRCIALMTNECSKERLLAFDPSTHT